MNTIDDNGKIPIAKFSIIIETSNHLVDEKYFSFDYKLMINGRVKCEKEYQSEHCWGESQEEMDGFLNELLTDHSAIAELVMNDCMT